jgi:hypothetical protein
VGDGKERASISPEAKKRVEALLSMLTVEEKITLICAVCGASVSAGLVGR